MIKRWRWVAIAVVLLLAAGAGAAYVATSRGSSHRPEAAASAPTPARPAVLGSLAGDAPMPAGLPGALAAAMRDPAFGGRLSGDVVDAATGRPLLDRSSSAPMTPASTAKLLTAVTALEDLGGQFRLTTKVVRSGSTLYLVGGGDVTLRARAKPMYPAPADIAQLALRTAAGLHGVRRVRLCADTSAWSGPARAPGWTGAYVAGGDIAPLSPLEVDEGELTPDKRPRVADPTAQAVAAFAHELRSNGVTVTGTTCRGVAPGSATVVAAASSPPVASLVQRMLTVSDNDLAEALGRTIAAHDAGTADFAGAAAAVTRRVAALGVDVTGLRLEDASGLSRLDAVTPRTLVGVLRLAVSPAHPELRPVLEGLPVAGLTGTLAKRYRRTPVLAAAGLVRAKTGTLAGVNTVAGTVVDADGRLLVFAFMTDRAASPTAAEAALDRLVATLQRL